MTREVEQTMRDARRLLEIAGSPSAARDVSALMDKVRGDSPPRTPLDDDQIAEFNRLVARRAGREPVSHLVGTRAFWMHDFEVCADVLDPRPETETLVQAGGTVPFDTVLDLGTGSGCVLLSLLYEKPQARGLGVDLSPEALVVARRNGAVVGVADRVGWAVSDWFDAVEGPFDLIVSNPPYIAVDEMAGLSPELAFEPRMALTDEGDGLACYRIITAGAPVHLAAGGWLMVEIGPTQGGAVAAMFRAAGLHNIEIRPDLDGRDRVIMGQKPL